MTEIRVLRQGDEGVLLRFGLDVFDYQVDRGLVEEFLGDPRHHLVAALEDGRPVGFASAVHYVHPDKPSELWVNEVAVAPAHRRRGLAAELLRALFDLGRGLGCAEAWVLTDHDNAAAMRLYAAVGGVGTEQVMFTFRLGPSPLGRVIMPDLPARE
jgi:ribosomal protein S18 acetylase RimI-like enzyme